MICIDGVLSALSLCGRMSWPVPVTEEFLVVNVVVPPRGKILDFVRRITK